MISLNFDCDLEQRFCPISNQEGRLQYKHVNDGKKRGESGLLAHRKQDTVGVGGDDAGRRYRDQNEGRRRRGLLKRVEGRWHSPMVQACWGRVLRT